ncbi:MAG TPA: hypothetical protein VJ954_06515 [Ignavibacteriaceae bacterium]|nr:hypothetical protein [Ignavibacteriaceae bacterium]
MGQQQLLLIVLGVIIVGVAVVLGIQYFSTGAEEAAKDELVAHSTIVAANAQQWFRKPVALGGGGNSFTTASGAQLSYPAYFTQKLVNLHSTTNGTYVVAASGDTAVTITATPIPSAGFKFLNVVTTVGPSTTSSIIN